MSDDARLRLARFLKKIFDSKRRESPGFTLRATAVRLSLSHSQLSRILSGQRTFPLSRTKDFIKVLHMDSAQKRQLHQLIAATLPAQELEQQTKIRMDTGSEGSLERYEILNRKSLRLLEKWHHIAVLDLSTTKGFRADMDWVARRLGLSPGEVEESVALLAELGLIRFDAEGNWRKTDLHIHLPADRSLAVVREYHIQYLEKAMVCLRSENTENDFEARLMTGLIVAADTGRIEAAKAILNEALIKAAQVLSEQDGEQLYHLGLQLFPITR